MKENKNIIAIKIFDFENHPKFITEKLGLSPTAFYCKGDTYIVGPPHNRLTKIRKNNHWEFKVSISSNVWIQKHINNFLEKVIFPQKEVLSELSKGCNIEFSIVLLYYDYGNPGFHFDNNVLTLLSQIGAKLDIDIYCKKDHVSTNLE